MNNVYGFDIEAVPLQLYHPDAKLLCATVSQESTVTYIQDHIHLDYIDPVVNTSSHDVIKNILKNPDNIVVAHNMGFDKTGWVRFHNNDFPEFQAQIFDTMIANFLLNPGTKNSLEDLAVHYLGKTKIDVQPENIPETPLDTLVFYNGVDAMLVYELYFILRKELEDKNLMILFNWLMKILKILIRMQVDGVNLDIDYIKKLTLQVDKKYEEIETELIDYFGDINFRSPKQLAKVLYEDLKLPVMERTKKSDNPSTGKQAIVKLRYNNFVPEETKKYLEKIIDYRKLGTINSRYLKPLILEHLGFDGRIHTSYFLGKGTSEGRNFGTISGRTSSSTPNLQNIPNKVEIEGLILDTRKGFIPGKGFKLYKADQKQLEMRVAAWYSKDEEMQKVFRENIDIHTYSLAHVFEEDYEYVSKAIDKGDSYWKNYRRLIKPFNFSLIYGASKWALQQTLLNELDYFMSMVEVEKIYYSWFKLYKGFAQWRNLVYEAINLTGSVETPTGRKRIFFDPKFKDTIPPAQMQAYYREGLNDLIQSLGNDISLLGLYFLDQIPNVYPLLYVHDSADGEYSGLLPKNKIKEAMIDKPKQVLSNDFGMDVSDLIIDVDIEDNLDHWS